nr:uncharacterized protein LOC111423003 [Onthophagus taurus]
MKVVFHQFVSIYCFIKNLVGIPPGFLKKESGFVGLLIQTCLVTLSIITMTVLNVFMLIIQCFLWGMDLWLTCKLGNNYGGRLQGLDGYFESTEEKIGVACMIILNHNEDDFTVKKRVQEMFKTVHNSSYKLSCTVERCLGYAYYLKNQLTSEDCFNINNVSNKECLSREELFEYIENKYMINLCNQKRLWYGEIFTQPILWDKENKSQKQTAILFVFRHCLGDGPSLLGLLNNVMVHKEQPEPMQLNARNKTVPTFTLDYTYFYRNPLSNQIDEPAFQTPHNKRHVVFYLEDKIKYIPIIKKLKNKLQVGFGEILMAGLTASLANILAKRGKVMDKCTTSIILKPIDEDIINGTYDHNNITNKSTGIFINALVSMQKGSSMLDRIKSIKIEVEKSKRSVDSLAIQTFSKLLHLIPTSLIKYIGAITSNITAGLSNIGGLQTVSLAGCDIKAVMMFTPFLQNIGFRLHVFSYENRLQLALSLKENMVRSREEAQEIIDNIFVYVDKLSEELNI